jgi:hypothetical protein
MPNQNSGVFRELAQDHDATFTEIDLHAGHPIPDICDHTVSNWFKISGIREALEGLLGRDGISNLHSSIAEHLEAYNRSAGQLLRNWLKLVYTT